MHSHWPSHENIDQLPLSCFQMLEWVPWSHNPQKTALVMSGKILKKVQNLLTNTQNTLSTSRINIIGIKPIKKLKQIGSDYS